MTRPIIRLFSSGRAKSTTSLSKLTPEEESHLRAFSARIISDRICEVQPKEVGIYLYPESTLFRENKWFPAIIDTAYWMLYRRNTSATRFAELTSERCENKALQEMFGLNPSNFNHRVYWLTLHSWMLHQRFLVEKLNKLESDYVDRIWLLPYKWMMDKGVPRHRLQVELEHAHRYSLKFSVELDQAISKPEMLAGQIAEIIWRTMFSEDAHIKSANDLRVVLLTKYVIRTLNYVLNSVPKDHFTQGAFVWPSFRTK